MPAPTPGTKVVGAAMVAADVRSDLDGFRSFVNGDTGLSASDVTAASIGKEQVYRPEHLGFPVSGSEGVTQKVLSIHKLPSTIPDRRHLLSDRESLFNSAMHDDTSTVIPWLAKTLELPTSSWVRATACFEASVYYDSAIANPEHIQGTVANPDVGGRGALGGQFELVYRSRATGTETTFNAVRDVQNPYVDVGTGAGVTTVKLYEHGYAMSFAATMPAGTYDVYVKFIQSTASSYNSPCQIVFSATNLLIEADFQ